MYQEEGVKGGRNKSFSNLFLEKEKSDIKLALHFQAFVWYGYDLDYCPAW